MSLVFLVGILGACWPTSEPPQVSEIGVKPSTTVLIGETVSLTIEASGAEIQFEWTASRGSLSSSTAPSVLYTAPSSPGFDTVTVKVTSAGKHEIRSIAIEVIAPTPTPTPTTEPTPTLTPTPCFVCYKINIQVDGTLDARVEITIAANGEAPLTFTANANSVAEICTPCEYTGRSGSLTISANGYQTYQKDLVLGEGELPNTVSLISEPILRVLEDFEGERKMEWWTPDPEVFEYGRVGNPAYGGNWSFWVDYKKNDTQQYIGADPITAESGDFRGAKALQMWVYGQVTIMFKLENKNNLSEAVEVSEQTASASNDWTLLRFDLAQAAEQIDLSSVKMLFFVAPRDESAQGTFYIDDIALVDGP